MGADRHRPELVKVKLSAVATHPALPKQDRAWRTEIDKNGANKQQRRQKSKRRCCCSNVETTPHS